MSDANPSTAPQRNVSGGMRSTSRLAFLTAGVVRLTSAIRFLLNFNELQKIT